MTRLSALRSVPTFVAVLLLVPASIAGAQTEGATGQLSQPIAGITTFHRVSTAIACGANGSAEAMAPLRQAGFSTVISFSEDTEPGYDRVALERAATAAGLRYVSIPFKRGPSGSGSG